MPELVHVPDPVEEVAFNITVGLLAQTVGLVPAVMVPGTVIKTDVVTVGPGHPATVAKTEYTPEAVVDGLNMVGFCAVEVKLPGPLQL